LKRWPRNPWRLLPCLSVCSRDFLRARQSLPGPVHFGGDIRWWRRFLLRINGNETRAEQTDRRTHSRGAAVLAGGGLYRATDVASRCGSGEPHTPVAADLQWRSFVQVG